MFRKQVLSFDMNMLKNDWERYYKGILFLLWHSFLWLLFRNQYLALPLMFTLISIWCRWLHVVNWSLKYGVVSWFTFLSCVWHFWNTSTKFSSMSLVSICSLKCLLCNKKSPRSLEYIIRKLQYKVYRYV